MASSTSYMLLLINSIWLAASWRVCMWHSTVWFDWWEVVRLHILYGSIDNKVKNILSVYALGEPLHRSGRAAILDCGGVGSSYLWRGWAEEEEEEEGEGSRRRRRKADGTCCQLLLLLLTGVALWGPLGQSTWYIIKSMHRWRVEVCVCVLSLGRERSRSWRPEMLDLVCKSTLKEETEKPDL